MTMAPGDYSNGIHDQEKKRLLDTEHSYVSVLQDDWDSDEDAAEYEADGTKKSYLQVITERTWFQTLVGIIIVANATVIGLETDHAWGEGWLFPHLEEFFLFSFCVELFLRMLTKGLTEFFSSLNPDFSWNVFDFVLVFLGVLDHLIALITSTTNGQQFFIILMRVFRLLRILRIFRIFRFLKQLYLLAMGFWDAITSVLWVAVICGLVLYICAIILTRLVGRTSEDDPLALVKTEYFGTVGSSMVTLFQLMAFPDMEKFQPVYRDNPPMQGFLILFIVFGAFTMVSVLTGVITEGMLEKSKGRQEEKRFERERARSAFIKRARKVFQAHAGPDITFIDKMQFDSCKEKVKDLCEADYMEFRSKDLDSMFDLVDYEGSGIIEVEELLYGMVQLSSELRPMSIMELRRSSARGLHAVNSQVCLLDSRMQMMEASLREIAANQKLILANVAASDTARAKD